METLKAIILGIIQGLTEFLPVSSSGHLEIGKYIMGDSYLGEDSMIMTVTLHAATALSTIVIFRKDIFEIISGLFKKDKQALQFSGLIILSMIPAVIVGVFFDEFIESFFNQNIMLVGLMLLFTGLILFIAERSSSTNKKVGVWDAIKIGIMQAVAILPGISRSGATIATSVMLGIDRTASARFSFLMVIPLILGKMAKDILSGEIASSSINFVDLSAGFAAAFITGLFACTWMIKLVKASKLSGFAYYCFALGLFAIGWMLYKG